MKICLIQPPIDDFYTTEIRNIPLGLLLVGAQLKNHEVSLTDLRKGKIRAIAFPEEFTELKKYYRQDDKSPFGLYKNYSRFGYKKEEFDEIIPVDIDIFGISANFTTYSDNVIEVIDFLRNQRPKAQIIVGGHACAATPGYFILYGADFEIYGEGELTFQDLIEAISKKQANLSPIPNLVWKKDKKIVINEQKFIINLDDLAFADYNIPGTPVYSFGRKKHAMLMISRGCPNQCSFCSIHQVMGYRYRTRSVDNVIAEIDEKIQQGFRSFDFEDDHFGGRKKWLNEFLDRIIENYSEYDLTFQAMNGITATNLDENLLVKMKQAGFSSLNLALVSEKEIEQDYLNRPFNTEKFTDLVFLAKKHDFFVTAYIILGLPGHTLEQMLNSILFLGELPVLIGPSFFYLVPKTRIFDDCQKQNKIPANIKMFRSSYMPYETDKFSRSDLMTLFRITRIINFRKETKNVNFVPDYEISGDILTVSTNIDSNGKRIQLGNALLKLLQTSGKVFGIKKLQKNRYQLREENVNQSLVELFLSRLKKVQI